MNSWKVAQALLDHLRATQGAHHAMLDLEKRSQTDLDTLHALYQQLAEKARRAKERSDMETSMSHTSPPSFFYHRHNQTPRLGEMFLKMKYSIQEFSGTSGL